MRNSIWHYENWFLIAKLKKNEQQKIESKEKLGSSYEMVKVVN